MTMTKSLSIRLWELLKSEFPHSSKNLAKFARSSKYTGLKNHYRMYKDYDGDFHLGFIDDTNCFCGRKLLRLACGHYETFAYSLSEPVDVTEWFIKEYQEKGMCAYTHMRHEWSGEFESSSPASSLKDGTIRTCIHCGKTETLKSQMVRETWWD